MGTAEAVYSPSQGLMWAVGPVAYPMTFILGKQERTHDSHEARCAVTAQGLVVGTSVCVCLCLSMSLSIYFTILPLFILSGVDWEYSIVSLGTRECQVGMSRWWYYCLYRVVINYHRSQPALMMCYCSSHTTAGLFFAKPMRAQRFVTMMDPFQRRYGNALTTALLLPALISDIIWVACILAALGECTRNAAIHRPTARGSLTVFHNS